MAAPTTSEEFFDLVRKSGVVEDKRLEAYLEVIRGGPLPDTLGKLAGILVRDAILTHFQAEQILIGKWRRFTIGKYKVLERLGTGGMGSVYLCEHIYMRRRVAVKVLPSSKGEDTSALERFYREARAVAALDHPNIVRAYDIDQEDKLHFLVMEYIDGASLQEIIKSHGPMDITRAAHYIRQAAAGLHHAHKSAGLVHRDVKPGNILVDRTGLVKVLDLGLARFFHDEESVITRKYDENVLGTADYLAPEQAMDSHSVDIRADIYSLGTTFYFCLTGKTPFSEGTVAQKLIWHQTRQPQSIRILRPEVPVELMAIIDKMMSKDPAERYQNPAEVVKALLAWAPAKISPPPEKEMLRLSPAARLAPNAQEVQPAQALLQPPRTSQPPKAPPPRLLHGLATEPPVPASPAPVRPSVAARSPDHAAVVLRPPTRDIPAIRPVKSATGKVAAVQTPAPIASHLIPGEAPSSEDAIVSWEALTMDTAEHTARADTIPQPRSPQKSPASAWRHIRLERKRLLTAITAGMVILAGMIWLFTRKSTAPSAASLPPPPATLTVSRSGNPDAFATVRDALDHAKSHDHIIIEDERLEQTLIIEEGSNIAKEVTIESKTPGKPILWLCPLDVKEDKFVCLNFVEGLHIKDIIFDGRDQVSTVMTLTGHCPGLRLDHLQIQGFKKSGLGFRSAEGRVSDPIILDQVRVFTTKVADSALTFSTASKDGYLENRYLSINQCQWEGPFNAAVRFAGPVDEGMFTNNRFYNCLDGLRYDSHIPYYKINITLIANTFDNIRQSAIHLIVVPQTGNNSHLTIKNNHFALTAAMVQIDEKARLKDASRAISFSGNTFDPVSREGNFPIKDSSPISK